MGETNNHKRRFCDQHAKIEGACSVVKDLESEMKNKVATRTMLGIAGLAVTIFGFIMFYAYSALFNQGTEIKLNVKENSSDIRDIMLKQERLATTLESFIKNAPPPHTHGEGGQVIK